MIRKPSPAMVVATIALFLALGGTSYAVSQINGALLRNRSVSGAKLKRHTVSAVDLNLSGLPKVPSAHTADSATTADTATNATHATTAATATTATNATHATTASSVTSFSGNIAASRVTGTVSAATTAATATSLTGHQFAQINTSAGTGLPAKLLNGVGGLTLECIGPSGTSGTTQLAVVNAAASTGSFGASADYNGAPVFADGSAVGAVGGVPATTQFSFAGTGDAEVSFSYKQTVGSVTDIVTGTFTMVINNGCSAYGSAEASSQ